MTLNGVVNRTLALLALLVACAAYVWISFANAIAVEDTARMGFLQGAALASVVIAFVIAIVTIFKKTWSPVTAPAYAIFEGFCIGFISVIMEIQFPGIVLQAVSLTFGITVALLLAYRSGLIAATENFKLGVVAATGGIALIYIVNLGLRLFTDIEIPFIHSSGPMGILFSLFVVVIASLNLVLDFDFIETGVEQRAPQYMEWYASFGLLVTLVWLYIEILRLLAKLRSR